MHDEIRRYFRAWLELHYGMTPEAMTQEEEEEWFEKYMKEINEFN